MAILFHLEILGYNCTHRNGEGEGGIEGKHDNKTISCSNPPPPPPQSLFSVYGLGLNPLTICLSCVAFHTAIMQCFVVTIEKIAYCFSIRESRLKALSLESMLFKGTVA
jgi:hypothetical protein